MTRAAPACAALLCLVAACQPGEIDPSLLNQSCDLADVTAIFMNSTHSCAAGACHNAMGYAANFDMASPGWERCLVGVNPKGGGMTPSMCAGKGPYLNTGSPPAAGLFLQKLTVGRPCGDQMPQIGTKLTNQEMACVQSWANTLLAAGPGTNCGASDAGATGQ